MTELLALEFKKAFNIDPISSYFCPGRVNLIGEHLDYNGGMVMPAAITMGTYLLIAPNQENVFRFRSLNFDEKIDLTEFENFSPVHDHWFNYPIGIIKEFLSQGFKIPAMDFLFHGDIPIGAGLSSSASIEIVTAFAINHVMGGVFDNLQLVKISKRVENQFIGVNCGIMDQFAVTFGEKDRALLLDCNTLDFTAVPFQMGDFLLAIINTNKPRKLSESKYNERVAECNEALSDLSKYTELQALCDLSPDVFYELEGVIADPAAKKRAKHVVEENARVKAAAVAMEENKIEKFGELMFASHDSLRDLYEVSGPELDAIVEFSKNQPGVIGARMTGAGFGGCAIALVHKDVINSYIEELRSFYSGRIGYFPDVYCSTINHGVNLIA